MHEPNSSEPLGAPARRAIRARPQVRPRERIALWRYLRRAFQLWATSTRLMMLGFIDGVVGGSAAQRELNGARRLRRELERLGGVFVKVGQLLSVRTDQYSWEVCREFAHMLDQVVPFPGDVAAAIVQDELRVPLHQLFSRFDLQPIASASIGQVHVGWLRESGDKVAIKIQRPGIADDTRIDLSLLSVFASALDTFNLTNAPRLSPLIGELQRVMDEELSYINEARATDDFRQSIKKRRHIYSPRVYFDHTTDRVLVLEFIEGLAASALIKAIENQDDDALARFERLGIRRKKLARRFYSAMLTQLFEHDICHSDPHPGNLILMPGNKVCFIDFGAVAYFGPTFRARIERVTAAIGARDVDAAVDATLASWEPLPLRDIDRFKAELKPIFQRMLNNAASKHGDPSLKSNGRMFMDSSRIAARYGFQAPWDHLRFVRILWEFDTTVVALNPDFDFRKSIRSYYRRRARRTLRRNLSRDQLETFLAGLVNVASTLPQDMQELRYQAFNLMRRSDHLFVNSMSKMSFLGKLILDWILLGAVSLVATLVYFRVHLGADELDRWLGAHLPLAIPWWVCLLVMLYMTMMLQRMRMRITEISRD